MDYKPFKATLMDSTDWTKIWEYYKDSKPQIGLNDLPSLTDIVKMGLPINGLQYYVIQFESSILFRDLILSNRDIMGAWAVSNRVVKINKDTTFLSGEILPLLQYQGASIKQDIEKSLLDIFDRLDKGELQEYVKRDLPLMTSTKYTVGIDLRTLVNFLYTLEVSCKEYFEVVGKSIIEACGLDKIYPTHPKRNKYKELSFDHKADRVNGNIGAMHAIYKPKVSMALYAQLVRKNIVVHSYLWNMLSSDIKQLMRSTCNLEVETTVYLTEDNINSLQATRTCWFANFDKASTDSWDYILSEVIEKKSSSKFLSELPCHGCGDYCVIKGDMMARVDKIDSHMTPCPILIEDPSIVAERVQVMDSNSTVMRKWKDAADTGVIQFNPDNELYRRYRK